jgi:hypothetical protein
MLDIFNAAPCPLQDFPQRCLSFGKRFSPQVFTIERQQVESEVRRFIYAVATCRKIPSQRAIMVPCTSRRADTSLNKLERGGQ